MDIARKILICGAGIAGPACGYWLHKAGYSVVIAERAKALSDGGQNVDIKGAGQQVISMMGLARAIQAKNTGECGVKFFDADGCMAAAFPRGAFGGLTADFEILRGDLAVILFEAVQDNCEVRFGTFVTDLQEKSDHMLVTFDSGKSEAFALVICAEGFGSLTRKMMLAAETRFRYLGVHMAFFKIPRRPEDDSWACAILPNGGTTLTLRPGNDTETTVLLTFLQEEHDVVADHKERLRSALKGRGVIADRVSADLDTVTDFYSGPMSQVYASRWSKGRFVMLGDAAYCPTPFTGEGTALALVGAYVLAGELARSADHVQAFETYERSLRPYVERAQARLSPRTIQLLHPKSAAGAFLARLALQICASRLMQKLFRPSAAKRAKDIADDFVFPDYDRRPAADA